MARETLQHFVATITRLVGQQRIAETELLSEASAHMKTLVSCNDWLPDDMAQPHPQFYRQYLLYGDPLDRFSLVSFVWGPGQHTPLHDHTVWGVIGMLCGAEIDQPYRKGASRMEAAGDPIRLNPGDIACVSPTIGDIHQVSNAYDDRVSISIHLYGGNIGKIQRHIYVPETGERKPFLSGYSNTFVPNLWAPRA